MEGNLLRRFVDAFLCRLWNLGVLASKFRYVKPSVRTKLPPLFLNRNSKTSHNFAFIAGGIGQKRMKIYTCRAEKAYSLKNEIDLLLRFFFRSHRGL